MISPRKIQYIARKWQKQAITNRKRAAFSMTKDYVKSASCRNSSPRTEKGHFVVYSADQRRFVIPLAYLKNDVFRGLLKLAEQEYGLPREGPITLPCNSTFMEYAFSLIKRHTSKDLEKALVMSLTSARCLALSHKQNGVINQHFLVCSF